EPPPSDGEPGGVPAMVAAPSYRIKVLDFGLVYQPEARAASERLTLTGSVVGTPAYMAPEQAVGKVVDARADLFSLGCVLYQMTRGERAFTGDSTVAVLRAAAETEPEPVERLRPETPTALARLIRGLLAKSPTERPPSAQRVVEALRTIEAGAPEAAAGH